MDGNGKNQKLVTLDSGYLTLEQTLAVGEIPGVEICYHSRPAVDNEELASRLRDADMLTSRLYVQYDEGLFALAPNLKVIFNNSVGVDNVDLEAATARGIKVYNCPGYNARAVAEFSFSLIVSLIRNIPAAASHVRAGGVEYRPFEGSELYGKTLGLVGVGHVGSKILEIGRGYGMNLIATTNRPSGERAKKLGIDSFCSLAEVLKTADILVLAVPLTPETKGLIGPEELKLMKKGAILINVARQTVVDELALTESLLEGHLGGAALDMVIEDPFYLKKQSLQIQELVNLPNVIVTPHIGGETREANERLGEVFLENVRSYLAGSNKNCVNFS